MTRQPRTIADYGGRETVAARRVLVDVAQVLAPFFRDSIVLVGGWVPELLLHDAEPPHSGSIDVDLALDAEKLREGRYADMVESLLSTGRYQWKEGKRPRAASRAHGAGAAGPPWSPYRREEQTRSLALPHPAQAAHELQLVHRAVSWPRLCSSD